jgi:hypothetical protein
MNKTIIRSLLTMLVVSQVGFTQTITETFGSGANAFSIDFVTIGNPGNAADTGNYANGGQPYSAGSVGYIYNIGKYEVSRGMMEKANAAANLGIVYRNWGVLDWNHPDRAAIDMTWYMAASFVNYLNVSQGYSPAYKFSNVLTGGFDLWSSSDVGYNPNNLFRNSQAKYFLPSVDEWYKAAYGSPSGRYFKYTNGSDDAPTSVMSGTNGVVYNNKDQYGGNQRPIAKIYEAGELSPYGTMAQGGNAHEWVETAMDGLNNSNGNMDEMREIRGGDIGTNAEGISSSSRYGTYPDYGYGFGFRVAMVPEPSAFSLLAVGLGVVLRRRRRTV